MRHNQFSLISGGFIIARTPLTVNYYFKNITISFITGLIIASIKGIWPGINLSNLFVNFFSLCLGCLMVYASEKVTLKKNKI